MIYFDTETTGLIENAILPLVRQPKIIEIGAVKVFPDGTKETFSQLLNPNIKLEPIITKVTGLTDADLKDKPTFRDVYMDLVEFFIGEDMIVAHNLPFDMGVLVFELRRISKEFAFPYPPLQIDTIEMAKPFYRGRFMKLQVLHEDLVGPYEQKHRAVDDCLVLQRVHEALMKKS